MNFSFSAIHTKGYIVSTDTGNALATLENWQFLSFSTLELDQISLFLSLFKNFYKYSLDKQCSNTNGKHLKISLL